jgi:hypothetical protein
MADRLMDSKFAPSRFLERHNAAHGYKKLRSDSIVTERNFSISSAKYDYAMFMRTGLNCLYDLVPGFSSDSPKVVDKIAPRVSDAADPRDHGHDAADLKLLRMHQPSADQERGDYLELSAQVHQEVHRELEPKDTERRRPVN